MSSLSGSAIKPIVVDSTKIGSHVDDEAVQRTPTTTTEEGGGLGLGLGGASSYNLPNVVSSFSTSKGFRLAAAASMAPRRLLPSKMVSVWDRVATPKSLVLVMLVLQVSGSSLLGRIVMTRGNNEADGRVAIGPSVLVFWAELIKIVGCGFWLWVSSPSASLAEEIKRIETHRLTRLVEQQGAELMDGDVSAAMSLSVPWYVLTHPSVYISQLRHTNQLVFQRHMLDVLFPALLFTYQANVLYIALRHLDVAVFQVLHQLKLPLTAICSAVIVGVRVTRIQWLSLAILFLGVVIAQIKPPKPDVGGNVQLGLLSVLSCVVCATISAVLMELVIKRDHQLLQQTPNQTSAASSTSPTSSRSNSQTQIADAKQQQQQHQPVSVSVRNVQLAVYLFVFTVILHFGTAWVNGIGSGSSRLEDAMLTLLSLGLDGAVWGLILIQAIGGVIVSLVLKYANNILKGCAIGCSIVVVGVINWSIFGVVPSLTFSVGASVVVFGVVMYNYVSSWKE